MNLIIKTWKCEFMELSDLIKMHVSYTNLNADEIYIIKSF